MRGRRWRRHSRRQGKSGAGGKLLFLLKPLLLVFSFCGGLLALEAAVAPNLQALAYQAVHNDATRLLAECVRQQTEEYSAISDYSSLMTISRAEDGSISMLSVDTALVNGFSSGLLLDIEESLKDMDKQKITVPLLAVTGSRLLATFGPELPVKVRGAAMPRVELKDTFTSAGINQTRHSIYLQVTAELMVTVPFDSRVYDISSTVLLAEGIIIGNIPETYVDF